MKTKLAAIIVTYHPNTQIVEQNISSFADDVDVLIIWDNSETPHDFDSLHERYGHLILHQDGHNNGLPLPYNHAIQLAEENECTHLMTMDQDSRFENFKEYRRQLELFNDATVGIFTCPVNHDFQHSDYRKTTVCQSGSIYTLDMIKRIGGFREDLFIGMVDAEMSLRALENGFKIYQIASCNLIHHIGSGRKIAFLGKTVEVSDYNPLRHYYDSRNRILLWHEFPYDYSFQGKLHHYLNRVKTILKIILFETQKTAKCTAIISGTFYGILNRTKPYKS